MENYQALIDTGKDGKHCVLFSNHEALEKTEIEDIFKRYGDVHEVKFHDDQFQRGIVFVRYSHMDDAVRAVDSLKGDRQITLREHNRKKQKNGGNFERRQGNGNHGQQNCDGASFIQQFGRQHNQDNGRSGNNRNGNYRENSHHGNSNNNLPWGPRNENDNQNQNDVPRGSMNANRNQRQNDVPWGSKNANGNLNQNDVPWRSKSADRNQKQNDQPWGPKSPNEYKNQNDMPRAQRSPNGHQKPNDTFQGPNPTHRYQESNDGLPDLVDSRRKPMAPIQNQSMDIPELVTADGKTLPPIKKQIIAAQEVIVANIHPKFGAPYILHLLDRYEPIAISNIMVEPKHGKRYCHVYFKSPAESQEVETVFDKKLLMDQRLVVMRFNRLVESAYFK